MSEELRQLERRREREIELRRERREEFRRDVVAVASRPAGARLLRRLLEDADIFRTGCPVGEAGHFLAGRRETGLRLWRLLRDNLPPRRFAAIALARDEPEAGQAGEEPGGRLPAPEAEDEPHFSDFF